MAKATAFLFLSLFLLLSISSQSRLVPDTSSNSNLSSDGIFHEPRLLFLESSPPFETCKQAYGILPCSTTFWGNLLIVPVYGYFTFSASKYISSGSELLLEILGSGFVGGVFLPIADALPNAIYLDSLKVKRLLRNRFRLEWGCLLGQPSCFLTLLWGSCVVVGKCDLVNSTSSDSQDSKRCSLKGSGVTTDAATSHAAKIMIISVIPFIVVQLPKVFHISSGSRIAVLISLFLAVAFLISYCAYQVVRPRIQKRRVEYVKRKHIMSGFIRHMHKTAMGRLLDENGKPNKPVIDKLFHRLDLNHDEHASLEELTALIAGINFLNIDLDKEDAIKKVMVLMDDFDSSGDRLIDEKEFFNGISRWLEEAKRSVVQEGSSTKKFDDFHAKTWEEYYETDDSNDENAEGVKTPTRVSIKAGLMLLLGTVIAVAFADPLVDSVTDFSNATNIPSFFISFIAMPLATHSREAMSAIIFARRKKQRTTSLTFSEIYGGVTTNNLICLAVFLALVYVRHLTWDFSAEVLVILIVCIVMGLFTSLSTTFPLWTCFVAYSLYPFSLVLLGELQVFDRAETAELRQSRAAGLWPS
ncbi:EF-hand domain-containing protein [Cinnamomum micranthum f. kanehirae]|uniref:EF-hand domain-containing protein n=1 Tax=Cinnamomum micranthum f. kanehirae TaxID=337451 RepID=A0A443PM17_9MAGN|nr:EF-hand domain-containing protein [Cinnamomum micranthum f. kanehirae]